MARCLLLMIVLSCVFTPAHAQPLQLAAQDSAVNAIRALYDNGSYIEAEVEARRFLEQAGLADSIRIGAEKVLAFALVAQGKSKAAVRHFSAILDADSTFELDPLYTSPKILSAFEEARQLHRAVEKRTLQESSAVPLRQPAAAVPARSVSWRVAVFPGWEQLHQDRPATGYALLGAGAAAAALSIGFEFERAATRQDYLAAASAEQARVRYDRYNRAYKSEVYSLAALAAIYVYSEIDAFINLPHSDAVSLAAGPRSLGLTIRF
jgi:hypothetical protein